MSISVNESQIAIKRISELLSLRGLTKAEFSRRMGVLPSYYSNWLRRGIPIERLPRAADILGVTVDELLDRVQSVPEQGIPVLLTGRIPIIGRAKLGSDGYFAGINSDMDLSGYLPIPSKDPKAYALKCDGTSMMPRIQPGEFVIAEPSYEASPGDEVVVQDNEGRAMVKRLLYFKDDCVFLGSVNELHDTIIISMSEVSAIHPVLAIVPKKLYCPV